MQVRPSCRPTWRWLVLLAALGSVSCSGNGLPSVQGKVLYKDQPASGALVTFHPREITATTALPTGLVREDGTFTLITGEEAGAPAGEYVVTVIWSEPAPRAKGASLLEPPDTRDRLRGAYANPATSNFKVAIKNGPNQLEPFRLK
jgi:hypothetical protein